MFQQSKDPTCSDANVRCQEIMNFKELKISEYPPNSDQKTMSDDHASKQQGIDSAYLRLHEAGDENMYPPVQEKTDEGEISSISSYTHTDVTEFPFPPVLRRTRAEKMDINGTLTLVENHKNSGSSCDENVNCEQNGLVKYQGMQGREYYEYYVQTKKKDFYTMYPQQEVSTLPKGTIFHFTGAPDSMMREDVKKVLEDLGANVKFVEYRMGSKEGFVRLSSADEVKQIIKKMTDMKLNIAGADLNFKVLSGQDEKRYHKKVINAICLLQKRTKGLGRKLEKAGYTYVKECNPDNDPPTSVKKKKKKIVK